MKKKIKKLWAKNKYRQLIFVAILLVVAAVSATLAFVYQIPPTDHLTAAATNSKPPAPSPTQMGWCVNGDLITNRGYRASYSECSALGVDPAALTQWYAWCPDKSSTEERTSCTCRDNDIQKSLLLLAGIAGRNTLIERVNDGQITVGPGSDWEALKNTNIAARLQCTCGVFSAGNRPSRTSTIIDFNGTPLPVEDDVTNNKLKGQWELIRQTSILFSRMSKMDELGQCTITPGMAYNTCRITGSYDRRRDNADSPHRQGLAIDFSCGDQMPSTTFPTRCTENTSKFLELIKAANPGFNIIEECNDIQRSCAVTTGSNQVIHLDLKDRIPGNSSGGADNCNITNEGGYLGQDQNGNPKWICPWTCS